MGSKPRDEWVTMALRFPIDHMRGIFDVALICWGAFIFTFLLLAQFSTNQEEQSLQTSGNMIWRYWRVTASIPFFTTFFGIIGGVSYAIYLKNNGDPPLGTVEFLCVWGFVLLIFAPVIYVTYRAIATGMKEVCEILASLLPILLRCLRWVRHFV